MGKSKRGDREYTREQRLQKENKILKRQLARLRNLLDRANLAAEDASHLRRLIKLQNDEDQAASASLAEADKQWACREMDCVGRLRLVILPRRDGTVYWRKCDGPGCRNRTKAQRFKPGVIGDDGRPMQRADDGPDRPFKRNQG